MQEVRAVQAPLLAYFALLFLAEVRGQVGPVEPVGRAEWAEPPELEVMEVLAVIPATRGQMESKAAMRVRPEAVMPPTPAFISQTLSLLESMRQVVAEVRAL